ncbi:hypothetical protein FKM82_024881 [Ascaphus truei]
MKVCMVCSLLGLMQITFFLFFANLHTPQCPHEKNPFGIFFILLLLILESNRLGERNVPNDLAFLNTSFGLLTRTEVKSLSSFKISQCL